MIHKAINKFENQIRLDELNPENTLTKIGFRNDMTLCDIGAGTGIFSFAAAKISSNNIYALEISDSMIELLKDRIEDRHIKNLIIKKAESNILPLDNKSCHMALMVTVLHELENKEIMLNEIKRILKEKGKFVIIEFHKKETPMGPPVNHRISEEFTEEICNKEGLKTIDKFYLGDNFYCFVFEF